MELAAGSVGRQLHEDGSAPPARGEPRGREGERGYDRAKKEQREPMGHDRRARGASAVPSRFGELGLELLDPLPRRAKGAAVFAHELRSTGRRSPFDTR
jgi:hypothetical protein